MPNKTVLLIDDDQWFLEPLVDALTFEGFHVITARTAQEGLGCLARERVDLVTVDIMLDPGDDLRLKVNSQTAGLYVCHEIKRLYPHIDLFCISVVSDPGTIAPLKQLGIRILTKGETSLRTVLNLLRSRLTGIAFTSKGFD